MEATETIKTRNPGISFDGVVSKVANPVELVDLQQLLLIDWGL